MELIIISDPKDFPGEKQLIKQLFQNGMRRFHLRKPEWSSTQIEKLLDEIPDKFYPNIVLHNHSNLAKRYGLGGIHFSERNKKHIPDWHGFNGTKSTSCHSLKDLQTMNSQIDYTFLSPVFPSISKVGYKGNFDFQEIASTLQKDRNFQVFALGGISDKNAEQCARLGFNGIAVLGLLWQKKYNEQTIMERFIKISNTCQTSVQM